MRTKAKPMPSGDELFKGKVTLGMETQGSTRHMLQFLSQVAENPSIRVVQMVGGYQGATVWLILRQPIHLTQMLSMMGSIAQVSVRPEPDVDGSNTALNVLLEADDDLRLMTMR